MHDTIKPILIMTWGNPSRGDDALGPQIYDLLQTETLPDAEILTDFQLQIEHTVDMEHREHIVFVDALPISAQGKVQKNELKKLR